LLSFSAAAAFIMWVRRFIVKQTHTALEILALAIYTT
jgi:hypothetical protein